jgi:hypothetical protein
MYRYPDVFARVNARFGFKSATNPKFVKLIRWTGIVEMTLAALSVLSQIVMSALGWK